MFLWGLNMFEFVSFYFHTSQLQAEAAGWHMLAEISAAEGDTWEGGRGVELILFPSIFFFFFSRVFPSYFLVLFPFSRVFPSFFLVFIWRGWKFGGGARIRFGGGFWECSFFPSFSFSFL